MMSGGSSNAAIGYLSMVRMGNCVMAAAGALLGALICADSSDISPYLEEVALSMVVVFLFTAAGNSMNDYFDREVDKVAHPERPLPRGLLKPKTVLAFSIVLISLSIVIGGLIGLVSFVIVVASVGVMVSYETTLKSEGLAGNLAISWLTGALFLFGGHEHVFIVDRSCPGFDGGWRRVMDRIVTGPLAFGYGDLRFFLRRLGGLGFGRGAGDDAGRLSDEVPTARVELIDRFELVLVPLEELPLGIEQSLEALDEEILLRRQVTDLLGQHAQTTA